jgi:uncharacterized radical SAM superfamily Fe-S cluster-containing enzyme
MKTIPLRDFSVHGQLIKRGRSRCLVCNEICPGEWVSRTHENNPTTVHIVRTCPLHGKQETCISSDARFYWYFRSQKNIDPSKPLQPVASLMGTNVFDPGSNSRGSDTTDDLKTCVGLVELMRSCNLKCPTCYADSPHTSVATKNEYDIDEIKENIEIVIKKKGVLDVLQLSGGEPTIHSKFLEILEWACAHERIKLVNIVTNGTRFAGDIEFVKAVSELNRKYDDVILYLQFDGVQPEGQIELRGGDFRKMRVLAINNCGDSNIPIILSMTVNHLTLPFVWDTLEFGLKHPHIRGTSFQPEFTSGRANPLAKARINPISVADIIHNLVGKCRGVMDFEDFTPLPCGDPNCAIISYLLKIGDELVPLKRLMDMKLIPGHLKDRLLHTDEDLMKCGCENEAGAELERLAKENTHMILIKPFMSAESYDCDRTGGCCTHVILKGGRTDSFCRHYATANR